MTSARDFDQEKEIIFSLHQTEIQILECGLYEITVGISILSLILFLILVELDNVS